MYIKSKNKKLQEIQNRAVKIIFKLPFDAHTDELCTKSNLPRILDRTDSLNRRQIAKGILVGGWLAQLVSEFRDPGIVLAGHIFPLDSHMD